ncbi:MAG TPA: hypothetical protein EYH31_12330 [Anaerolineae bacterium]|nr:hypothetical protein [Anaerolineae bacterium]
MSAKTMPRRKPNPLPVTLSLLLFLVYLLSGSGGFHIVDEVSLYAVTENLVRRGALDTNAIAWAQWVNSPAEVLGTWGVDGNVYSKKGVAPVLLAVPLRWLARWLPGVGLLQTTLLFNGIVTVANAWLLWQLVLRLGYRRRTATGVSIAFGLGTAAWPYATHFFGEPVSALALTGALYALLAWRQDGGRRHLLALGLWLALTVATSPVYALLLPFFGLYWLLVGRKRWPTWQAKLPGDVVAIGTPLALIGAGLLWYNTFRFGSPFNTGYHVAAGEWFNGPLLQGLWGLLLSPYRGLFWHIPLAWGTLWAFPRFWQCHRPEAALMTAVGIGLTLIFSKWWIWWGGFAWGPRFLVPLSPYLALMLAPLLEDVLRAQIRWRRALLAGLLLLSGLVQLLAVSVNYVLWEIELRSIYPTDWHDPLKYGAPAMTNFLHSPVLGQVRLLMRGLRANSDLAWLRMDQVEWGVFLGGMTLLVLAGWLLRQQMARRRPSQWLTMGLLLLSLAFTFYTLRRYALDPRYGVDGSGYPAILAEIQTQAGRNDTLVTVAPYHYHIPMNRYDGPLPIYGFAQEPTLPRPETEWLLRRALAQGGTIWLVTAGLPPLDPSNGVELWLNEHAYLASDRWFDDFRLLVYGSHAAEMPLPSVSGTRFGQPPQIKLVQASWSGPEANAGSVLAVALDWQSLEQPAADYRLFVQLLGADGTAKVQRDVLVTPGGPPTSTWEPGTTYHSRLGLYLAKELPVRDYRLIVGWYDPATGQRLPVTTADGQAMGDFYLLGVVVGQAF